MSNDKTKEPAITGSFTPEPVVKKKRGRKPSKKKQYFTADVDLAIKELSDLGYEIYLVSHKTKYGIKHSRNINILEISQERIFNWIKDHDLDKKKNGIIFCNSFLEKIN